MLFGVVLVWVYALYSSYHQAVDEVGEWDETRIEQTASALLTLDTRDLSAFAKASLKPRDDDDDKISMRLLFEVTGSDGRILAASPSLPSPGVTLSSTDSANPGWTQEAKWHTYAAGNAKSGRTVRIFEQRTHRSELSTQVAQRIARPLVFALPVLAVLIWLAIGSSLAPLRMLSKAIEGRSPDGLEDIDVKGVPDEVQPLIAALNTLLLRLRHSLDRERAFTSDAAHELKTPLSAIKVQAQVALTARDSDRQQRAMQRVVEAVDRSTHLADQLLTLARIEEAMPPPDASMDLSDIARACTADQLAHAGRKQMSLTMRADSAVIVQAPPALMRMLLDNLVDNAIKYGNVRGRIEISVWRDAGTVYLKVCDDGPGVAEVDLPRLRDRFFRGTGHSERGSGLGLSIVARIVDQLRGKMEYTAGIEGKGFGVRISLPSPAPR
jgi:two-component system sensor histidine kinase QseC